MSTSGHAACLTPKNRFLPAQRTGQRIGRYVREGNGLQLALRITLGTTTGSVNAFDAVPEQNSFVCCAGPSAILSQVDEHLNITQRLFRANPQASPLNSTHSFYNPAAPPSTPGRNHRGSPLKDRGHGVTFTPNLKFTPDSPSHTGAANNRAREATCVSLSHEGKLLAVGEVRACLQYAVQLINVFRQDTTHGFFFSQQRLALPRTFPCQYLRTTALASPLLPSLTIPVGYALLETYMTVLC